jgi:transposase
MIEAGILKLQRENELLREENRLLRQKVDLLIRQLFGKKSEKLSPGQMEMLLCGEETPEEPVASAEEQPVLAEALKRKPQSKDRRPRIPEHLPVEEEIIDPDEVKEDPSQWRQIGAEVSEQLDYTPGRFIRRRLVRRTWVKRQDPDGVPLTAPLSPKLLDRGILAPGLLAHVVVGKYADHLPLYRQEQIFKQRYGVELGRNTLCRGVELAAEWLQPVVRQMVKEQFSGGYVQMDETPAPFLSPGKGTTSTGFFWASNVPKKDTVYHWAPGRGYEHLKRTLPEELNCILQTDDYTPYKKLSDEYTVIAHANCWAHARRYFKKALDMGEHPVRLGWILHQIGRLYRVEEKLRAQNAGPALRAAFRQSESLPIINRLHRLWKQMYSIGTFKPQSLTGKAVSYALRQIDGLKVYTEYGQVEIDNNLIENAMRPIALGRKNWMFIGGEEAGWTSAVIYTIVQSCKNHGIDPYAYLKDVLERMPSMTNHQIHTLTPRAWAKEQNRTVKLAS